MAFQKILRDRLAKIILGGNAKEDDTSVDLGKVDTLHILKGIGVMFFSFILGRADAVFSCYPFGISLLSTINKFVPYTYMGLLLSSLTVRPYSLASAVVYTVVLMLRFALCRLLSEESATVKLPFIKKFKFAPKAPKNAVNGMFDENILLRCTVSCFAAFVFGLYRLISGGFLYYDLFGLLAGFLICPLLTLVLTGMFTSDEQFARFARISSAALVFITVYALRDYSIFGFSPAFMAAVFVTLWAASSVGGLKGCALGLFVGLACGGVNTAGVPGTDMFAYSIGAAPCIMAIMGLCVGAFWRISRVAAISGACAVAVMFGLTLDGYAVLARIVPDVMCAAVLFLPLARYGILPKFALFTRADYDRAEEDIAVLKKKEDDTVMRMNSLSEAFAHLSDTLYSLSDRVRRPGVVDLKQVCDKAFEAFCSHCSMQSHCLERDYMSTLDAQSKITAALYKKGRSELDDVPPFLRERCFNITAIIDELNVSTAKLIEKLIRNDKTEAFALDYEAMSKLLAEQISKNEEEYKIDTELTAALRKSLRYMGIGATRAICYGARKKQIVIGGVDISRVHIGGDDIRESIERTVGTYLNAPRFSIDGDNVTMTLSSRRRFKVESAKATSIKEAESANGDTVSVFENKEDYFYTLISDGMGSGREAAFTSKLCSVFIEKLLMGGNGKAVTLEMLNGFMRSRGTECSATIDLAEIDLITGEACFVKSGAAPSFVVRGGNLYKLQSKTVPIGIMHELDAEKIRFDLIEGDILIMLSDGITQSLEDGVWLANLITYEWDDSLSVMADKIIDNAAINNRRSDDMTVILCRVMSAEAE